jgi:adenylate kinase
MSKSLSNKKAIFVMGPPGSGKGTQAELLADKYELFHFDTGRVLEGIWHDPKKQKDPIVRRERVLFDTGKLNTPSVVLKMIKEKIKELSKIGESLVFSGSPRTFFEAFGDSKNVGLIKTLEKLYGKKNIIVLLLKVDSKKAIARNVGRMVCSVCGMQLLSVLKVKQTRCPFCGGELRKRTLDKPEVMLVRLQEFANRTKPILEELKKRKFVIHGINANVLPYQVFEKIKSVVNDLFKK